MNATILDTETTSKCNPKLIEAAYIELGEFASQSPKGIFCQRYLPSACKIDLGAMAVHHIMEEDLTNCPPPSTFKLPPTDYLIGHNIDFDWKVIGSPDIRRIDTLALAHLLWPKLDSHTQSALLYRLERPTARETLRSAHSAAADVGICLTILGHICLEITGMSSWEDLWRVSEAARVPKIMPFGKHKGQPVSQVPASYKAWLLRQPNVDPYLRKALQA